MELLPSLICFLLIVGSGYMTAYVAHQKGYSAAVWFWLGMVFSVLAIIAAAGLPDKRIPNRIAIHED